MKDFIEFLVKQIVSQKDAVKVEEVAENDQSFTYIITVDKDDMGMIIGKEGRTIKSIRTLAKVKAVKDGTRVNVTLSEPQGSEQASQVADEVKESSDTDSSND